LHLLLCIGAGAYAINPVVERACSAQHLQLASGCPPAAYWAGSFAWDMTSHLAVTLLSLAIFAAYGDQAAVGSLDQVSFAVHSLRGSFSGQLCSVLYAVQYTPWLSISGVMSCVDDRCSHLRQIGRPRPGIHSILGGCLQVLGTFTLLMAYGAAVIPLAYACAFGFSSHSAAQVLRTALASLSMTSC